MILKRVAFFGGGGGGNRSRGLARTRVFSARLISMLCVRSTTVLGWRCSLIRCKARSLVPVSRRFVFHHSLARSKQVLDNNSWLSRTVQESLSFAAYWHDPLDQAAFASLNIFLADINNVRAAKNATYKANMLSLNKVFLLYSTNDRIVVPLQSPWFSFFDYVNGSDSVVDNYSALPDYTECVCLVVCFVVCLVVRCVVQTVLDAWRRTFADRDWIGMRSLMQAKKLVMQSTPCGHQGSARRRRASTQAVTLAYCRHSSRRVQVDVRQVDATAVEQHSVKTMFT